ncbi:MAG: PGRS family protein [Byssovorax sp.]
MRTALWGMVVAGSTLAGWLSLGAGCGTLPANCKELFSCPPDGVGGTSTTTGAGGDSGPPPECVPALANGAVADTCGLFVSSTLGDDAAAQGTKATPFKTLTAAVAAAGPAKKPVFACAESFTEPVNVTAALALFGGLDCTMGWIHVQDAKTTLTAAADTVPLTLSNAASSVQIADFKVQAVDATVDGGSSIAVIADAVAASFTRCELTAGNGVKGADGMMPAVTPGPTKATDATIAGNNGSDACSNSTMVLGGLPKENVLCGLSVNPLGGAGGIGFLTSGSNGSASPANAQTALGGTGQPGAGAWGCVGGAGLADGGLNGESGMDGAGASGMTSLGALTLAGYTGASGISGGDGKPGQGGGGGGAAKGKSNCGGASGGGGGTGGCGGLGGTGGKAGGASIGLVSLGATLSFDTVSITVGNGGAGGDGGDGRSGKTGGAGGLGGVGSGTALPGCRGGDGGLGGFGGKGGGGRGGHVIGIAATGSAAPDTTNVTFTKGTHGDGGKGAAVLQDGDPGVQVDVQLFP